MSKLAESHSEMEFYFIQLGPIRSYDGSRLGPVIKDTAFKEEKERRKVEDIVFDLDPNFIVMHKEDASRVEDGVS